MARRSKCRDCEYWCDKCKEILSKHAEDQIPQNASLCWCCKNAIPAKDKEGKYTKGCVWSIHRQPVEGWEVSSEALIFDDPPEGSTIAPLKLRIYCVRRCPLFERG